MFESVKKVSGEALKDYSLWFGFLLSFLISIPMVLKPGYVAYTDFIHGPQTLYSWQLFQVFFNSLLWLMDFVLPAFSSRTILPIVLVIIYLSGRFLAKTFTDNKLILTAAATFSVLNLFVYERILYGQFGVVLAYAFLMSFTAVVLRIFRNKNFSTNNLLLAGLFAGLAIDSSLHTVFMLGLVMLVTFIIYGLNDRFKIHKNLFAATGVLGLGLLFNSVAISSALSGRTTIGNFVSSGITAQDLVAFQTSGNSLLGKIGNVVMLTGFWGKDQQRFLDITLSPLWWLGFLPFFVLLVYGFYCLLQKDRKFFYWSLILTIFSILLSIASSTPILSWLYTYIPFYTGLREPHKWVMVLVAVYLLVSTYALNYLYKKTNNHLVTYTFIFLLILLQFRFFLSFWGQLQTFQYPQSWYNLDTYLSQNITRDVSGSCDKKVLALPWHLYMSYPFSKKISANLAAQFFTCPVVHGTNMEFGGIYDNSVEGSRDPYNAWLFSKASTTTPADIQYIILFKTVDWAKYSWLEQNVRLEKVDDNQDFVLYKVKP